MKECTPSSRSSPGSKVDNLMGQGRRTKPPLLLGKKKKHCVVQEKHEAVDAMDAMATMKPILGAQQTHPHTLPFGTTTALWTPDGADREVTEPWLGGPEMNGIWAETPERNLHLTLPRTSCLRLNPGSYTCHKAKQRAGQSQSMSKNTGERKGPVLSTGGLGHLLMGDIANPPSDVVITCPESMRESKHRIPVSGLGVSSRSETS